MVKRWRPIAVGVATFVLAVSVKNDFLYFLFGLECMLYLFSFLQVHWLSRRVRMHILLPQTTVFRGKPFQIRAELSNSGFLPVPQLLARVAVRAYPERQELLMKGKLMLDSNERGSLCFAVDSTHCGCLELRADQLMVTDYLGLFQCRCPVDKGDIYFLYVLPDCLNAPVSVPEVEGTILSETGDDNRRGSTSADISEIREYQPGDPVKLIHWKLYARLQDLMVRELSDSVQRMTWLFLNLQEQPGKSPVRTDPDAWDHFVETVAMVSMALLDSGEPHAVLWVNASGNRAEQLTVSDEESLQHMLCALLRADTYSPKDHSQLLKEIFSDETKGTCIEIDLQGNFIRSEGPG